MSAVIGADQNVGQLLCVISATSHFLHATEDKVANLKQKRDFAFQCIFCNVIASHYSHVGEGGKVRTQNVNVFRYETLQTLPTLATSGTN
jgi:hypothetical protein